jgi:2'-5' RNA ligase
MIFYIASFVELSRELDDFRNKYDPKASLVKAHATLIFPFEYSDMQILDDHLIDISNNIKIFDFSITSYSISFDNLIFLDFKLGLESIKKLHKNLYTKNLAKFLRNDLTFKPHITIGDITHSGKYYSRSEITSDLENLNINLSGYIDSFSLIKIVDLDAPREIVKTYYFKLIK